jgi:hypothetical protein
LFLFSSHRDRRKENEKKTHENSSLFFVGRESLENLIQPVLHTHRSLSLSLSKRKRGNFFQKREEEEEDFEERKKERERE